MASSTNSQLSAYDRISGTHRLGALAGIGFTVALFVTDLAYGTVSGIGVDPAMIGILAASLAGGLLGAALQAGPGSERRP